MSDPPNYNINLKIIKRSLTSTASKTLTNMWKKTQVEKNESRDVNLLVNKYVKQNNLTL